MFVSRSSFEKPSPFERCWRTASPSRYSTSRPRRSSSGPTISAIVVFPAPDKPVNQSVKPALQLVRAGPAACPFLLVGRDGPGAGDAADRTISGLVQRVVGNLVHLDVGPDLLLVPVGERVELPDTVALRPLELRGLGAARRLIAPDARDPGVVGLEGGQQRLDLPDVTAAIGVALPEIRPLLAMLLRNGQHRRGTELEPVALDEAVARLVRLAEEELRVELDHGQVEPELGDHVHEHRRLLLPRAREAELVAEPELAVG